MPLLTGQHTDGWASGLPTSFAGTRNHAGNRASDGDSGSGFAVVSAYFAMRGTYVMHRTYLIYNTSSISVAPSAATLYIYGYNVGDANVIAVKSAQDPELHSSDYRDGLADVHSSVDTALTNSDGSGAGTFVGLSGFKYSEATSSWNTSGYNTMTLLSDARDDMASLNEFKICLMEYDHDFLDVENTTGFLASGMRYYEIGDGRWPYINYTAAGAVAENATFFGANF